LILVDTSVWVDHLRRGDAGLAALLDRASVLAHPFVIGELACGSIAQRAHVIGLLQMLPQATVAQADEVLTFIERRRLDALCIGYVDANLLASVALSLGSSLSTRGTDGCLRPRGGSTARTTRLPRPRSRG
jgi:predicted nucleic acid-binding protein